MQIRVSGKQMEIGGALPIRVRERLEYVVGKHFSGGAEATVVFSREGAFYRADCTMHLDAGLVLKAEGEGADTYRAFDVALKRVERRVRRYMRKLQNHHDRDRAQLRAAS
jgi:ribosomal subunit interface protein